MIFLVEFSVQASRFPTAHTERNHVIISHFVVVAIMWSTFSILTPAAPLPFCRPPHTRLTSTKRFTNLNCDACQTLVVLKMKSDFHTINKKKCSGSKLNFEFYMCLPNFILGLTILARKVRQVYKVISLKC